jgi:hypothetical protein
VIRKGHCLVVVRTFLIGCAILVVAGCAGVRSEAPEEQVHTEATASEEARCGGTRTIHLQERTFTTNDVPGCPKGGLLSGTDSRDLLDGKMGDDEIRGLGAKDELIGGSGSDVIYGGPGDDSLVAGTYWSNPDQKSSKDVLHGGLGGDLLIGGEGDDVLYGGDGDDKRLAGGAGEDVIYGGDGNDLIDGIDGASVAHPTKVVIPRQKRDELYCGEGEDHYFADKLDYVDSSCEVKKSKKGGANL